MSDPTPEVIAALVTLAKVHAQQCNGCNARLATRSYVDPDSGARVWVCDAAACAELWRCDRCGATGFVCSYCPQCGHTGIALATLEFADAPKAAGLRYANAWRRVK